MAFHRATARAIREMATAIQERISGHLFRRRSASQTQSQCAGDPSFQPPVACANCSQLIFRNSLGYPLGIDGVGEDMLAAYLEESGAYRAVMSRGGLLPDSLLERDLTPAAYLAVFAVPTMVAEIRRLRLGAATNSITS